jgi:hypothetical protein
MMMAEHRDQSFHDVESLRAFTKVPILVRVPAIVTKADRLRNYRRSTMRAFASVIGLVFIIGAFAYLAHDNEQLVWMFSEGRAPQQTR